jgi:predicted PolB exonuclease-like 3'-5' exonuclease
VERVFDILNNPWVQVFEKKMGIKESLVLAISKPSKNWQVA